MNSLYPLILTMGAAWALSGMVRLLLPRNRTSPDTPYAIFVIAVFLFCILDNLLRPQLIPMKYLNYFYYLSRVSYYLVGPALLFYVRVLLVENYRPGVKSLLHFIPFFMGLTYLLWNPGALNPEIIFGNPMETVLSNTPGQTPREHPLFSLLWDLSKNLSRLIYSGVIVVILKKNSNLLPDRVSSIYRKNTLSWLRNLILIYTCLYLFIALFHVILPEDLLFFQIAAAVGRSVPAVLFVFIFSIISEEQPVLGFESLRDKSRYTKDPDDCESRDEVDNRKYKKSGISDLESKSLYLAVYRHLETSRAYVDPDLTLDRLSEQMGETRHRISVVINRESGKRFYSFINGFRLSEFKKAVLSHRYPDYTILGIALECGFRSSSGFYSMVKKELGTTPKALVREIQEK